MSTILPRRAKQTGAALIVGLVLLLVLTVLSVSTLSTSGLAITMAGNDQFAENAFQLAESGNAVVFQRLKDGTLSVVPYQDLPPTPAISIAPLDGSYQTRISWAGNTALTKGYGTDFCRYVWISSSTGTSARQATAVHRQGFWIGGDPEGCAGKRSRLASRNRNGENAVPGQRQR